MDDREELAKQIEDAVLERKHGEHGDAADAELSLLMCENSETILAALLTPTPDPQRSGASGDALREAVAKAIWETADDEVGWEATLSLAAKGEVYMNGQVEFVREQARAVLAALSVAPAAPEDGDQPAASDQGEGWKALLEKALPFVGWASTRGQIIAGVDAAELYEAISFALTPTGDEA